jgi:putative nucleotidyltransferase with HDIG domain
MDYGLIVRLFETLVRQKDAYEHSHGAHVASLARSLGDALDLRPGDVAQLQLGAQLHDIGKVALPDSITNKPGKLTRAEMTVMREHPVYGYELTVALNLGPIVQSIVLQHHENFDGSGYPRGLSGKDISIFARIVHVSDVFEALIKERAYRPKYNPQRALAIMDEHKHMFDPELLELLRRKESTWTSTLSP